MKIRKLSSKLFPYILISPFALLFLAFVIYPLGNALYLSLFRETMMAGTMFIWFDNYAQVFRDAAFWRGVSTMLMYGLITVPIMAVLATVLALLLDSKSVRFRSGFRLLFFLPYAVPGIIAALIWGVMYGPTFGLITQVFAVFGLPAPPILTANWILLALANIAIWELVGYKMIIVYAALKNISPELADAASIDGATQVQYSLFIKVPLVVGAIMVNVLFSIIGTLQLFNEPTILQALAPGVIRNDFTPNMYARTLAFTSQNVGYAGATSFVLAAMIAILSFGLLLIMKLFRRQA